MMIMSFSSHGLFAQTNLVKNPSFEDGFTSWSKGPSSSYTNPLILDNGFNSSTSVGYSFPSKTTGFYQNVPIQPNKTYVLSFWYKAKGDNSDARLWSRLKDDDGNVVYLWSSSSTSDPLRSFNKYLPSSDFWTEHSIEFTNTTATFLELAIRAYTGSETAFDEFSLIEKSELGTNEYYTSKYKLVLNTIVENELLFNKDCKEINIFNTDGQLLIKQAVIKGGKLDVSNFKKGIYIIHGEINGKKVSQKFIVK